MTCSEAQDLLAGALADALAAPERTALESHLGACAPCMAAGRRLREAWTFLDGLQPPAVPMNLGQRLKATPTVQAAPEVVHEPAPPPMRIPRKLLFALALLLCLAAGAAWEYRHLPVPPAPPKPLPEAPPIPWSHEGIGPMTLTAVPGAELWAEPASHGSLAASGTLRLDEGLLWGTPPSGQDLRLQAGAWALTITRGRFSVRVSGTAVVLSCHGPADSLAVVERGPGFQGPLVLTDGTCVLLVPGRSPIGPKPLRSPYPGESPP